MILRDYQIRAIQAARDTVAGHKYRRLVIYSPTGSGKTILGMALIKGTLAKGKRVAFVANRIGLVKQASEQLTNAGIDHGIIQGQNTDGMHKPCMVCSIQTLARRGSPDFDMWIIDESHAVAGSKEYRKLIFSNSMRLFIGLTATPFAKGMAATYPELGGEALFQALIPAATIRELIDQGFLVDCDIYAPTDPDLTGVKTKRNEFGEKDYVDADLGKAMDKAELVGDIVSHWKRLANDKPTVCFASSIAHSKHITETFLASGVTAEHIDCYTDEAERAAIMARVASHQTRVISNVGILTEGWDFPACEVMILARPTKSLTRWIQMVGRILRPYQGKARGLVLDHSGSTVHLGYPTEDLPLELCDGTAKGEQEKKQEQPKKCHQCQFVKPLKAHICPKCGFAPQATGVVASIDGELGLVERKAIVTKTQKQQFYSELLAIRREKGYIKGWVSNQYRNKFGVYPRGLRDFVCEPSLETRNYIKSQMIRFAKSNEKKFADEQRRKEERIDRIVSGETYLERLKRMDKEKGERDAA